MDGFVAFRSNDGVVRLKEIYDRPQPFTARSLPSGHQHPAYPNSNNNDFDVAKKKRQVAWVTPWIEHQYDHFRRDYRRLQNGWLAASLRRR
ncbi:hypothetical protein K443DRAFT_259507 [Laccaria amethystina LaAM-08-1]|uniref:Unplaced genomic scaffold K443scaffold_167, whole genome shotgun sequence n=1 Tax=Laccaria amethystina LaAM-08-1 TaxID=1095629 RepID=A0A0C9X6X5_9AGAR|nr:hypothetical protein K443DRAFT_259507 [Laccaria amethystina LaAM-08-1]